MGSPEKVAGAPAFKNSDKLHYPRAGDAGPSSLNFTSLNFNSLHFPSGALGSKPSQLSRSDNQTSVPSSKKLHDVLAKILADSSNSLSKEELVRLQKIAREYPVHGSIEEQNAWATKARSELKPLIENYIQRVLKSEELFRGDLFSNLKSEGGIVSWLRSQFYNTPITLDNKYPGLSNIKITFDNDFSVTSINLGGSAIDLSKQPVALHEVPQFFKQTVTGCLELLKHSKSPLTAITPMEDGTTMIRTQDGNKYLWDNKELFLIDSEFESQKPNAERIAVLTKISQEMRADIQKRIEELTKDELSSNEQSTLRQLSKKLEGWHDLDIQLRNSLAQQATDKLLPLKSDSKDEYVMRFACPNNQGNLTYDFCFYARHKGSEFSSLSIKSLDGKAYELMPQDLDSYMSIEETQIDETLGEITSENSSAEQFLLSLMHDKVNKLAFSPTSTNNFEEFVQKTYCLKLLSEEVENCTSVGKPSKEAKNYVSNSINLLQAINDNPVKNFSIVQKENLLRSVGSLSKLIAPEIMRQISAGDPKTKASGLELLQAIGDTESANFIAQYTKDNDPKVRIAALAALRELKAFDKKQIFLDAYNDQDPEVRAQACLALSSRNNPDYLFKIHNAIRSLNVNESIAEQIANSKLREVNYRGEIPVSLERAAELSLSSDQLSDGIRLELYTEIACYSSPKSSEILSKHLNRGEKHRERLVLAALEKAGNSRHAAIIGDLFCSHPSELHPEVTELSKTALHTLEMLANSELRKTHDNPTSSSEAVDLASSNYRKVIYGICGMLVNPDPKTREQIFSLSSEHDSRDLERIIYISENNHPILVGNAFKLLKEEREHLPEPTKREVDKLLTARKLGINFLNRFPEEIQGELLNNRLANKDDGRPLAIICAAKEDHNHAFYERESDNPVSQLIKNNYRVLYYEAGKNITALRQIQAATKYGTKDFKSPDVVMFMGHGNIDNLTLGKSENSSSNDGLLDTSDKDELKKHNFDKIVSADTQVVLDSCLLGYGEKSVNNLANMLREVAPQLGTIWSSTVSHFGVKKIEFNKNGKIKKVNFRQPVGRTYQAHYQIRSGLNQNELV